MRVIAYIAAMAYVVMARRFEARILRFELLSSDPTASGVLSAITIGALQDTGWYDVNSRP